MMSVDQLCPELVPDLGLVAAEVAAIAAGDGDAASEAARFVAGTPGKRLRAGLLLLAARACGYRGPRCVIPAAVVEVLHAVSLVHDDVVDGADMRRGRPAARALWGNKMAVLVGDHLLAGAFRRLAESYDAHIMTEIAKAAVEMCQGQIREVMSAGPQLAEAEYLEIVSAKTASLFAASARIGAVVAGADEGERAALDAFGRAFGIAYQVADDIADLVADPGETGKSAARDLAQGQVTLPVIHSLAAAAPAQRAQLLALLDNNGCEVDVARLRRLVADTGGFDYAADCVRHFREQALTSLHALEQSSARDSLTSLAHHALASPRWRQAAACSRGPC